MDNSKVTAGSYNCNCNLCAHLPITVEIKVDDYEVTASFYSYNCNKCAPLMLLWNYVHALMVKIRDPNIHNMAELACPYIYKQFVAHL